jgi:hypothetical protein
MALRLRSPEAPSLDGVDVEPVQGVTEPVGEEE